MKPQYLLYRLYVVNLEAIKCDNQFYQRFGKDKKFFYILFLKFCSWLP